MIIRDIPLEERREIGRQLYEARLTPLPWVDAARIVMGRPNIRGIAASALMQFARDHALRTGQAWPPDCELSRDRMKAARAVRRPKRDWLILTDQGA